MRPDEIERRSMDIIESELTIALPPDVKPIVKRVIHATADFSFAESLRFSPGAVAKMRAMLARGAAIVTDTNMAAAGINARAAMALGCEVRCFMADEQVALEAVARGVTRAAVSAERALSLPGEKLLVSGNAPTFLMRLLDAGAKEGVAVIGAPVGFVHVVEAKERLWQSGLDCIVSLGRRGGSNVAAAIVNALMYGIEGVRPCGF